MDNRERIYKRIDQTVSHYTQAINLLFAALLAIGTGTLKLIYDRNYNQDIFLIISGVFSSFVLLILIGYFFFRKEKLIKRY